MIKQKTAIIVGAGSCIDISNEVFCDGAELLRLIHGSVDFSRRGRTVEGGQTQIARILQHQFAKDSEKLQRYVDAAQLIRAKAPTFFSIDQLIRDVNREAVSFVGKLAIAFHVGRMESRFTRLSRASSIDYSLANNWFVDLLKTA